MPFNHKQIIETYPAFKGHVRYLRGGKSPFELRHLPTVQLRDFVTAYAEQAGITGFFKQFDAPLASGVATYSLRHHPVVKVFGQELMQLALDADILKLFEPSPYGSSQVPLKPQTYTAAAVLEALGESHRADRTQLAVTGSVETLQVLLSIDDHKAFEQYVRAIPLEQVEKRRLLAQCLPHYFRWFDEQEVRGLFPDTDYLVEEAVEYYIEQVVLDQEMEGFYENAY